LYIPEADLEYLIRTLSDARSRATELAVAISSRLGAEHRLTQLATSAVSHIENTLQDVRDTAAGKTETAPGLVGLQDALQATSEPGTLPPGTPLPLPPATSFAAATGLDSEHWLSLFVDQLLAQARSSAGITFESVERALQQRRDEYLRDFLTARRMYRTYPHLFPEIAQQMAPQN
jgi:hypothetical protein